MATNTTYHQEVYRKCCTYLENYLDVRSILSNLVTHELINAQEAQAITRKLDNDGPQSAVYNVYEILYRKPSEDSFWQFLKCLEESKQNDTAEVLKRCYNRENEYSQSEAADTYKRETSSKSAAHLKKDGDVQIPSSNKSKQKKYAYCIKFYDSDLMGDQKKDNISKKFVKELKEKYTAECIKRNLPVLEVYDNWQQVGKNKINQVIETVKHSHIIILLFTKNFNENMMDAFFQDYAFYTKLGKDIVFPVGLIDGQIPEHMHLYSPIHFNHSWLLQHNEWNCLLNGIFNILPKEVNKVDDTITGEPMLHTHNDEEIVSAAGLSSSTTDQQNSTPQQRSFWSRLNTGVRSLGSYVIDLLD